MSNQIIKFLNARLGVWDSQRRYIYGNDGVQQIISTINTFSSIQKKEQTIYIATWRSNIIGEFSQGVFIPKNSKETKGTMSFVYDEENDALFRDKGYLTKDSTISCVSVVGEDILRLDTSYDYKTMQEDFKFLDPDHIFRQTTVTSNKDGSYLMVGQYYETRIKTNELINEELVAI